MCRQISVKIENFGKYADKSPKKINKVINLSWLSFPKNQKFRKMC